MSRDAADFKSNRQARFDPSKAELGNSQDPLLVNVSAG
jgi:hypothetical protein